MTHVICRLTAKHRDQLQNPMLGNRVWATSTWFRGLMSWVEGKCPVKPLYPLLLSQYNLQVLVKQTSWLKHRISPCAHWRQPRRGCRGHIPPILLRTFEYSRPILIALRSLSLKPISFGYKTPPVRFSQTGSQSSSPQPWTGVDATTYAVLQTAVLKIDCWAWTRLLISWMIV